MRALFPIDILTVKELHSLLAETRLQNIPAVGEAETSVELALGINVPRPRLQSFSTLQLITVRHTQ